MGTKKRKTEAEILLRNVRKISAVFPVYWPEIEKADKMSDCFKIIKAIFKVTGYGWRGRELSHYQFINQSHLAAKWHQSQIGESATSDSINCCF